MKFLIVVLALVGCVLASSKCPQPTGQFPHPLICEYYYNCWEGTEVLQTCNPGLEFDADKHECSYCAEVDCGSRKRKTPCPDLRTAHKH